MAKKSKVCPHCSQTFQGHAAISKHFAASKHGWACPWCPLLAWPVLEKVDSHARRVHNKVIVTCLPCKKVFANKLDRTAHDNMQHPPPIVHHVTATPQDQHQVETTSGSDMNVPKQSFMCPRCGRQYGTTNDLAEHYCLSRPTASLYANTSSKIGKTAMPPTSADKVNKVACSKDIPAGENVYRTGEDITHLSIAQRGKVSSHQSKTSGNQEKSNISKHKWPCLWCPTLAWSDLEKTQSHCRWVHNEYVVACLPCEKVFAGETDLAVHRSQLHPEFANNRAMESPKVTTPRNAKLAQVSFKCPRCGLQYSLMQELQRHYHDCLTQSQATPLYEPSKTTNTVVNQTPAKGVANTLRSEQTDNEQCDIKTVPAANHVSHDPTSLPSPPMEAGTFSTVTDVTMSPPAPTSPIALMNGVGSGREFETMQSSAIPPACPAHNLMGGNEHGTPLTPTQEPYTDADMAPQDSVLFGIMCGLNSSYRRPFDDDLADAAPVQESSSSSGDFGDQEDRARVDRLEQSQVQDSEDEGAAGVHVVPTPQTSKSARFSCRICSTEPTEPTTTMCGHLFCHGCIIAEISRNLRCPVCNTALLIRLRVD